MNRLGVCSVPDVPEDHQFLGVRRRPEHPALTTFTSWQKDILLASSQVRPEAGEPIVLGWGMSFAEAVGALVDSTDARSSLVLVQRVEDPEAPQEKGIAFSTELVAWLAAARAGVDIDQYLSHDCGEDS